MRVTLPTAAVGLSLIAGCGSEVITSRVDGDTSGPGGASVAVVTASSSTGPVGTGGGGSGGSGPSEPSVESISAPDEKSVLVRFTTDVATWLPSDPSAFAISSTEVAPLVVVSSAYDPSAHELMLTTERQRLGASYSLKLGAPATPIDGFGGPFLGADTATFWALDFDSFTDYSLVANRIAIGDHAVVYIEQGWPSDGANQAITRFDTEIFPKETALLSPPNDVDDNPRIVLLGLDGSDAYAGYFSPVDTLTAQQAEQFGYHSNELDMLYVNMNYGFDAEHVIPHEFSHLLYQMQHGWQNEDWPWQNEGLAECAVHVVNGSNPEAVQTMIFDPTGEIGQGLSLVDWQFGNYAQYAQAYLFWTYLAAQTSGDVTGFGALFDVFGNPDLIDAWIQEKLGKAFSEAQRDFLLAQWMQAPSGAQGFGSMIDWSGMKPATVPLGTPSVPLENFAGALFLLGVDTVDYPGTQGPHILYAGADAGGAVDLDAPFAIGGGVLVALNTNFDYQTFTPEPSGPNLGGPPPPPPPPPALPAGYRDPAWRHPPPFDPRHVAELAQWRERTRQRP